MDQKSQRPVYEDEITLRDVVAEIRGSRTLAAILLAVFTLGGMAIGLFSEKEYTASTVLSPVTEDNSSRLGGGLSALAGQFGGLASLAGISLNGNKAKDEAIAVMKSEMLTETYIHDQNLLPVLYAKLWDPVTRGWRTSDPDKIPTLWKANRYFDKTIRGITEDKKGLVTLSIRWKDRRQAAQWANDLVKLTNSYLRNKAITEAERNIAYLNAEANKTSVVEVKKAIYTLLETEINRSMVARGREEYALKVLDPAFVPEKPSSAGPRLLALLGFGLGCTAVVLIAFGRRVFRA
jgi:hypothetical protein